jgi:S1-C subfamily serine protease
VIDGKSDIILLLNDGRQLAGEVVASDPAADLAVLRVQAEDLNPLPLGQASDVQPGELVCAVGNPYGLRETVSWGSISSLDRMEAEGGGREMIQHDATLHRGHSGGPLVNVRGELIGINRSIFSDQNTGTWQGIGFAVPANVIRTSLRRMLAGYDEKDPLPGLRLKGSISSEDRQSLDLGVHNGVLLEQVYPNSPAARQGLLPDDLIMGINGRRTPDLLSMQTQLQGASRGEILEFHLIRGGLPLSLRIQIPEETEEFQSL